MDMSLDNIDDGLDSLEDIDAKVGMLSDQSNDESSDEEIVNDMEHYDKSLKAISTSETFSDGSEICYPVNISSAKKAEEIKPLLDPSKNDLPNEINEATSVELANQHFKDSMEEMQATNNSNEDNVEQFKKTDSFSLDNTIDFDDSFEEKEAAVEMIVENLNEVSDDTDKEGYSEKSFEPGVSYSVVDKEDSCDAVVKREEHDQDEKHEVKIVNTDMDFEDSLEDIELACQRTENKFEEKVDMDFEDSLEDIELALKMSDKFDHNEESDNESDPVANNSNIVLSMLDKNDESNELEMVQIVSEVNTSKYLDSMEDIKTTVALTDGDALDKETEIIENGYSSVSKVIIKKKYSEEPIVDSHVEVIEVFDDGKPVDLQTDCDAVDAAESLVDSESVPKSPSVRPPALNEVIIPFDDGEHKAPFDLVDEETNSRSGLIELKKDPALGSTSPCQAFTLPCFSVNERASAESDNISLVDFKEAQIKEVLSQDFDAREFFEEEGDFGGENVEDLISQSCFDALEQQGLADDYRFDGGNTDLCNEYEGNVEESEEEIEESEDDDEDEEKFQDEYSEYDEKLNVNMDQENVEKEPYTYEDVKCYQTSILDNMQMMLRAAQRRLEDNLRRQQEADAEIQDLGLEVLVPTLPPGRHVSVAKKTLTIFGAPYFKDHRLFSHPKNADTLKKQSNKELDVYITYPHCWTTAKRSKLAVSVREDALNKRQKTLLQKREQYVHDIKAIGVTEEEKEEIGKLINEVDKKLSDIAKLPDDKLFVDRDEDFDWMKISTQDFDEEFSAKGCELQWKNQLHPLVNTGSFTKEEDELLKMLAKATDATGWDSIARELGTGRTGIGCFMRYMEKHNVSVNNRRWETSEDERLRRIVAHCRINNHIPWSKVSYYIDHRTKDQCYQRYLYSLKDDLRHGTFLPSEDLLLIIGHKRYGPVWHKICETIPGRTPVQLHARWNAFLKVNFQSWTQAEDVQLLDLVHKNGMRDWVSIAKQMKGRTFTRMQVRNRFQFIVRSYRRNPKFTLDQIKYKNTPGIAMRRKDDIFKKFKDKYREWVEKEGLVEEIMDQEDHVGSVEIAEGITIGNYDLERFIRYLQTFLPEPEEPRPLAKLPPPLPKAVSHLKEEVLGPVGRTVSNKLKLARKKKKFKKLPVVRRREAYRNCPIDRKMSDFFRATWVGKGGRAKTHYTNEEIEQHTMAMDKLGQILDFSKFNLKNPYQSPDPDGIDPKELALYSAYKYFRLYGKHQNRYDPKTGLTTISEEPTDLSISSTPLKTIRTYSRKNKKPVLITQAPSIAVPQFKKAPLKEGEKRLTLVLPTQASVIGLRGQLLHSRYINGLANPDLDKEEKKKPMQTTLDKMVQEGIYNSDLLLKAMQEKSKTNDVEGRYDGDVEDIEPGTPSREQADQLLVKRFTQIFLLPALLSCKKPARQEQLFEDCEFLDEEPVSASNPYDTSDIIRSIEKPRVSRRKPPPRPQVEVTPRLVQRSAPTFNTPSTPQRPSQILDTPQQPSQISETPQRTPQKSSILKRPPQAHGTPLGPPQTSVLHQSPPHTHATPQSPPHAHATPERPPQASAILQRPLQTPSTSLHIRPSGTPQQSFPMSNLSIFQLPDTSSILQGPPQSLAVPQRPPQASSILQRPLRPLGMHQQTSQTYIAPICSNPQQDIQILTTVRPSFQTTSTPRPPFQPPSTHQPSCQLPDTPKPSSQTLSRLVHHTPFSPPQLPLRVAPQEPVNRKRPAMEQPISDKAIPLKKRTFPPMRPPPPLSPNPATIAPRSSPSPASAAQGNSPKPTPIPPCNSSNKATATSHNSSNAATIHPRNSNQTTCAPRISTKTTKPKLTRTNPNTEVIHVFSHTQLPPDPAPASRVLTITTGSSLSKQIRDPTAGKK